MRTQKGISYQSYAKRNFLSVVRKKEFLISDIPALITAAQAKGVSHFIIEDESPSAALQLPESIKAVQKLLQTGNP